MWLCPWELPATSAGPKWPPGRILGRKCFSGLGWSWCRMAKDREKWLSACLGSASHSRALHAFLRHFSTSPTLSVKKAFGSGVGQALKPSSGVQHPALMEQIRGSAVNTSVFADEVWSDRDIGELCSPASLAHLLSFHHLLSIKRLVAVYFSHCGMKLLLL